MKMHPVVLASFACAIGVAKAATDKVDFGRAWRVHIGSDPAFVPATFPTSLAGCECAQPPFEVTPVGRMNSTDCAAYAGAVGAYAWTWNPEKPGWWARQCYVSWEADAAKHCTGCSSSNPTLGAARSSVPAEPAYAFASPTFDDSAWEVVDAPHDAVIQGQWNSSCDPSHGYMCRNITWYRKHATLPASWAGRVVRIVFGAVFQRAELFVNGQHVLTHGLGYTPFEARIDQALAGSSDVVVALRADGRWGSGHWYEGSGLWNAEVRLEASDGPRLARDGVYAPPVLQADGSVGVSAEVTLDTASTSEASALPQSASVAVRVTMTADPPVSVSADVPGALPLGGASGAVLSQKTSQPQTVAAGETIKLAVSLPATGIAPWSVQSPRTYGVAVELLLCDGQGSCTTVADTAPAVGWAWRNVTWTADDGLWLNGQHVLLSGFCDHDNTFGVGSAVPPRFDLLRSQAMKAVGSNHRRFSHNPPPHHLTQIMSRIGVLTMSENRDYGMTRYIPFVTDFARRDRNEPAVALWSVCNEVECISTNQSVPAAFTAAFREADPSRLVGANVFPVPNTPQAVYDSLQVQGLSHQKTDIFQQFHSKYPDKPIFASESSSCQTQLSEPVVNRSAGVFFDNFNQPCGEEDWSKSGVLPWSGGVAAVWTMTDYIGESGGWPHVSSSFGQLSLDFVPKPAAFWYATRFLGPADAASRPRVASTPTIRIVDDWAVSAAGVPPTSIRVFASSPSVRLSVNGHDVGFSPVHPVANFSVFTNITFAPGEIVATAADEHGNPLPNAPTHRRTTPSTNGASTLQLNVVAPSPATGTGSSLVADGRDCAVVRATVTDSSGTRLLHGPLASDEVTFSIVSGPGRIAGTGSPDPTQGHSPPSSPSQPAYHGIASAVVCVTVDATTPTRGVAASIDNDSGKGSKSATIIPPGKTYTPAPIVVAASTTTGKRSATTSIDVTLDWQHASVLAVAGATATTDLPALESFAIGM